MVRIELGRFDREVEVVDVVSERKGRSDDLDAKGIVRSPPMGSTRGGRMIIDSTIDTTAGRVLVEGYTRSVDTR